MATITMEPDVAAGREREIAVLVGEYLEGCRAGETRFAVVSGSAGIGKSHVFSGVARELANRGARVLQGLAPRGGNRAFGLFSTLALDLLQLAEEVGTPARATADLSRRLAPLSGGAGVAATPREAQLQVADALAELFVIAGQNRAALLLHDLDAADPASLELLGDVAAALLVPGTRAGGLVALSHRQAPPGALTGLLDRLPGVRVRLAGLDLEDVRSYLSRSDVAERLLDATSGDPGRLEELIQARPADLARRRLERLDPAARRLLLAAAVLGAPRSASTLTRVAGVDAGELAPRLAAERFLSLAVLGGRKAFSLSRDGDRVALLEGAAAAELRALHAAAADALEAGGALPEEVAHHLLAADPRGRGVAAALRAARSLQARGAPAAAVELFRAALAAGAAGTEVHRSTAAALRAAGDPTGALRHVGLARKGACARELRELRSEAASLCITIGKLGQAEKLCRQSVCGAEDLAGADAPSVRAYTDLCEIRHLRGEYRGAIEACRVGLAATDLPVEWRQQLRNTLGKSHLALGEHDEARAAFAENHEEATAHRLCGEIALARINLGVVAHRRGDRAAAMSMYRAALEIQPVSPMIAALARGNLGALHHEAGDFEMAAGEYAGALAACTRARRLDLVSRWAANFARLQIFLGDTEQALQLAHHARRVACEIGNPYLEAQAQLVRGEALELQGELAAAGREIAAAQQAFSRIGNPRYQAEAGVALARVNLARRDVVAAGEALEALSPSGVVRENAAVAAEIELLAAEVLLARGEARAAGMRAARAGEILRSTSSGVGGDTDLEAPWRLSRLLAAVATARGRADTGAEHAARAVQLLEELARRVPAALRPRFLAVRHRSALLAGAARRESLPERGAAAPAEGGTRDVDRPLLVGGAPSLQRIIRLIPPVARSQATLLIRGESGTGKELLAAAVHRASPRRDMPLVTVNCAAMHEELLLSELFGHERGAFTGADRERKGRFEHADGGTLFLDEIGDLPPKAQVSLLRVLQEREFERVGGTRTVRVDVRVICASNRDLEQLMTVGRFRHDLYYRIKGVVLELPPLRDRREDIPVLASHFLERMARARGEPVKRFSEEALELLGRHPWPGNVRELENLVEAVSILAPREVVGMEAFELHHDFLAATRGSAPTVEEERPPPGDVDFYALARAGGLSLKELRHRLESQMIGRALVDARGNISWAARLLGMKRSRLSQIVHADAELRLRARGSAA